MGSRSLAVSEDLSGSSLSNIATLQHRTLCIAFSHNLSPHGVQYMYVCIYMQQIEVDYLSTLLEGQSPDPLSAHRVLDSLLEDKLRLRVCESVLEHRMKDAAAGALDHVETTIFLLHYITSKLGKVVGEKQRLKYMNWLLGAKVGCRLLALRECSAFWLAGAIQLCQRNIQW